ncbi:unnamed protein product [Polarella glacialis]|uniref:PpiC domain-containing protein n=1 Tax=Polarella glacialis TaxID=89957 RepID=A0A813GDT0_POLGL|nr:unnamed protein product [Polarella glacialis]
MALAGAAKESPPADSTRRDPTDARGQELIGRDVGMPRPVFEESAPPAVAVWDDALSPELFRRVRESIDDLCVWRVKSPSGLCTFWLPREAQPKTAAEVAGRALLKLLGHKPEEFVGIEWWCRNQSAIMGAHFHYDTALSVPGSSHREVEERTDFRRPTYSSVLYLGDVGGPTVVLDQVADRSGHSPPVPHAGCSVATKRNRYLAFPGELRHGGVSFGSHSGVDCREPRFVILYNFWKDFAPGPPACQTPDFSHYRPVCSTAPTARHLLVPEEAVRLLNCPHDSSPARRVTPSLVVKPEEMDHSVPVEDLPTSLPMPSKEVLSATHGQGVLRLEWGQAARQLLASDGKTTEENPDRALASKIRHQLVPNGRHAGSAANSVRLAAGRGAAWKLLDALLELWLEQEGPEGKLQTSWPDDDFCDSGNTEGGVRVLGYGPGVAGILKPAGVTTEEAVRQLSQQLAYERHMPEPVDLHIVSRLDHPTSGVLPLALGAAECAAAKWLEAQFAGRLVGKEYVCLCEGPSLGPTGYQGNVSTPLHTVELDGGRASRTEVSPLGRQSFTGYEVLARYMPPASSDPSFPSHDCEPGVDGRDEEGAKVRELMLLRVRPLTGRTHQIRVHLASIDRPLVGDLTYGAKETSVLRSCPRLFLHCRRIEVRDLSGKPFVTKSELPHELEGIVLLVAINGVILIGYKAFFGGGGGAGRSCSARHILMKLEDDIQKAKARIEAGEKFGKVARDCREGGSLGTFSPGQMVPAFDRVCFDPDTKVGEVLGPVQTHFGFHLIIVDARQGVDPEVSKELKEEKKGE